jgi:hypothetical protein
MQNHIVAFSGYRYFSGKVQSLAAASKILAALPTGVTVATGCCPSGLDLHIRLACAQSGQPIKVFKAVNQNPQSLRARTLSLVAASAAVFVFPRNSCPISSGSWLAVWAAVRSGLPVFVYLPSVHVSALPCLAGVIRWCLVSAPFASAVALYSPIVNQTSLFNQVQPITFEFGHLSRSPK